LDKEIRDFFRSLSGEARSSAMREMTARQLEAAARSPVPLPGFHEASTARLHAKKKAVDPEGFAKLEARKSALEWGSIAIGTLEGLARKVPLKR
jgi:hypothetical protein